MNKWLYTILYVPGAGGGGGIPLNSAALKFMSNYSGVYTYPAPFTLACKFLETYEFSGVVLIYNAFMSNKFYNFLGFSAKLYFIFI